MRHYNSIEINQELLVDLVTWLWEQPIQKWTPEEVVEAFIKAHRDFYKGI